ncbi:MAG: ribonuclease catalytic domain-containing protein [Pseudomonadota bacterium]
MFVFYEEDGQFKAGRVMADHDASLQVEAASGKRSKIKADRVFLRFASPEPAAFMDAAHKVRDEADADFLWEAAGAEEFDYLTLAEEYFGRAPQAFEAAGILMRLFDAPMHFYKKGRGRFKPAPAENLAAAKASVERKAREAAQIEEWKDHLVAGRLPAWEADIHRLLFKPDKNALAWKALDAACAETGESALNLLNRCGAIADIEALHKAQFLLEYFPRGTGFPEIAEPFDPPGLPEAEVAAFSIDDAATTEIDDAFSLQFKPEGGARVGIHIACPALGIPPGSQLDDIARARLSTVYFPGDKITMLPEAVIDHYTLIRGQHCPALSMYLDVATDFSVQHMETRLEAVRIADNLRHETLDEQFNEDTIGSGPDYPYRRELEWLWGFASTLEAARGAANQTNRQDYNFRIERDDEGKARVAIVPRRRGSPIDKVVAELMILANSRWGTWLKEKGVPGIFRNQSMGKTRLSTQPGIHQGLGVENYAWSSSPLRRYVDLINQRQILSLVQDVAPPYGPRNDFLFAVVRDFELTYDAYAEFQRRLERYWCLRWLLQENVSEITAKVIRDDLARLNGLPMVVKAPSLPPGLAADTVVRFTLSNIDLLSLELHAEYAGTVEPASVESS